MSLKTKYLVSVSSQNEHKGNFLVIQFSFDCCHKLNPCSACLTKAGLGVGVDVLVFTPFYHTFQDGH